MDVLKDVRVANLGWLDIQATQFVLPGMVQWLVRRDEPTTWTNRRLTYPTCRKPFLDSDTTGTPARATLAQPLAVQPTSGSRATCAKLVVGPTIPIQGSFGDRQGRPSICCSKNTLTNDQETFDILNQRFWGVHRFISLSSLPVDIVFSAMNIFGITRHVRNSRR